MTFLIGCVFGAGIATIIWSHLAERHGKTQFNAGRIRGAREAKVRIVVDRIQDEQFVGTYSKS